MSSNPAGRIQAIQLFDFSPPMSPCATQLVKNRMHRAMHQRARGRRGRSRLAPPDPGKEGGRTSQGGRAREEENLPPTAIVTGSDSGIGKAAAVALGGVDVLELAEHGITVNAVAPGEVSTRGRPGDAREIANLIAWLAGEDASYVTGESLVIDGGMQLRSAMANRLAMHG